ncbi:hypothetical protein ACFXTH_031485 [Malus domestica]
MTTGYRECVYLEPSKTPTFSTQEMGRCFDKNPVTTALQPLSLAVLRKNPRAPRTVNQAISQTTIPSLFNRCFQQSFGRSPRAVPSALRGH